MQLSDPFVESNVNEKCTGYGFVKYFLYITFPTNPPITNSTAHSTKNTKLNILISSSYPPSSPFRSHSQPLKGINKNAPIINVRIYDRVTVMNFFIKLSKTILIWSLQDQKIQEQMCATLSSRYEYGFLPKISNL
jgi:hypothetical protein